MQRVCNRRVRVLVVFFFASRAEADSQERQEWWGSQQNKKGHQLAESVREMTKRTSTLTEAGAQLCKAFDPVGLVSFAVGVVRCQLNAATTGAVSEF